MRTPEAIRWQLKHFRDRCSSDPAVRQTWADALEWVLAEGEVPEISAGLTPFGELIMAAIAARHALRSYQYGNESIELAAEIADSLDTAIRHALEQRDLDLRDFRDRMDELIIAVEELTTDVAALNPSPAPVARVS